MQIKSKILVWDACNFEKVPKMGLRNWNVTNVYLKSCKNYTKGDRDIKYGLKYSLGCPLSYLVG